MTNVNNVDLFSGIQNKNQNTGKETTIDESLKKSQLGSVFAAATSTAVNAKHKNISFWDTDKDGKLTESEMRKALTEINKGNRKTRNSDKYTGKKDIFQNGNTNTAEEKARFYALNQAMNYNWNGTVDTENNQFKERQAQIEAGERDVEKSTRVMLRQLLSQKNGLKNLSAKAEDEIGDTVDFTKMTTEQTERQEELSDGVKKALNTTFKGKRVEGKAQNDEEGNTVINFKDGTSIKLDKNGNKVTEYFNKDTNIATYEDTDATNDHFEKKTTYSLDAATKKTLTDKGIPDGLDVTQITTEGTKKTIALKDGGKVVIDGDNVTRYDKDGKEVNKDGTAKPAEQPKPADLNTAGSITLSGGDESTLLNGTSAGGDPTAFPPIDSTTTATTTVATDVNGVAVTTEPADSADSGASPKDPKAPPTGTPNPTEETDTNNKNNENKKTEYTTLTEDDLKEGSKKIRDTIKDPAKLKELLDKIDPKQKARVIALVIDEASHYQFNTNEEALAMAINYVDASNYEDINKALTEMNITWEADSRGADGYGLRDYIKSETSGKTQRDLLNKLNEKVGYKASIQGEKGTLNRTDAEKAHEKIKNGTKLAPEDAIAVAKVLKSPKAWSSFENRKNIIYSIRDKETLAAVEKELGMSLGLWLENNYKYDECGDLVRHVRQFM